MRTAPGGPEAAVMLALLAVPAALTCAFLGSPGLAVALALAALPAAALLRGAPGNASGLPLAAAATAALLLTTLGGEGRLLPAAPDWLVRDAPPWRSSRSLPGTPSPPP